MNQIAAIPTMYEGIQFRSRLEATWARFFDLLELNWTYEPEGFDGWIPDFMLYGKADAVYVEVKPETEISWRLEEYAERYLHISKSINTPILLVGRDPATEDSFIRTVKNHTLESWSSPGIDEIETAGKRCVIGYWISKETQDTHRYTQMYGMNEADYIPVMPAKTVMCYKSQLPCIGFSRSTYGGESIPCIHCGEILGSVYSNIGSVFDETRASYKNQIHFGEVDLFPLFAQAKNEIQWRKCK